MGKGAKIGLTALVALALFAGAFGAALAVIDRGGGADSEPSKRAAEPTSAPTASGSMPYLADVAEMCALVDALHAEAPDGELEEAQFMHDRLTRISVNSSAEIQAALASYIHGFALVAEDPAPGDESLEAFDAVLDGRSRLIKVCSAVGAPGYE